MNDKGSRDELKGRASGAETVPVAARLCYVDDSRTSAYVVRRLLQPFGYQVDYFQSAEPAFVALIQEDYDLLLTDLKVSSRGMDGDDLIRTLRQSGHPKLSSLPVIVITGASDARVLVDVYDAGANQVMSKPVDADELDGHIRRLLSDGKPELRVVEQYDRDRDRDNVVSLSAAQRPVQKQSQSSDDTNPSLSATSPTEKEASASSTEAEKPDASIPVLDAEPPALKETPPDELDAESPVQADMQLDDEGQTDLQNISEPEPVISEPFISEPTMSEPFISEPVIPEPVISEPVINEKESLLERAVLKQEEQKKAEIKENAPSQGGDEDKVEQEADASNVSLNDDVRINDEQPNEAGSEEVVITESSQSVDDIYSTINVPAENENILDEMDRHALVVRERDGLFSDSNIFGAFRSLLELVGIRKLIQRMILAGIGFFVVLMLWNLYFDQGQPVETVLVETGEIFQSITVPGRVLSKQQINISSAQTGRTVKILVKEGDRVKAGQVLAKMDDRELISRHNRAKANLAVAREGVTLAKRTLNRLRKAYKKGAVARRFVEDAEVDLSSARSQAGIAVEEARSAKLELSKQKITAPFPGTITARFVEVGQWVGPSESLFTLVDESQREIEVRVDAADSVAIDVGQVVAVSSDAFPGLEWHESVSRLGTAASNDRNTNSVKVYISLGNDAPSLRFGQQVDADIRTAWNPNTLKVPFEALISRDGQTLVAVLSGGQVQLKPVETGIEDFSMVEIKQGLNDGELVILSKGQFLQNGDKVHPARGNR